MNGESRASVPGDSKTAADAVPLAHIWTNEAGGVRLSTPNHIEE